MEKLLTRGVVYYMDNIDKNINPEMYEPVSYDGWKMVRELEPTKFNLPYGDYIKLKETQFNIEVERRSLCSLELKSYMYDICDDYLHSTKNKIIEIQTNPMFHSWLEIERINQILNK